MIEPSVPSIFPGRRRWNTCNGKNPWLGPRLGLKKIGILKGKINYFKQRIWGILLKEPHLFFCMKFDEICWLHILERFMFASLASPIWPGCQCAWELVPRWSLPAPFFGEAWHAAAEGLPGLAHLALCTVHLDDFLGWIWMLVNVSYMEHKV